MVYFDAGAIVSADGRYRYRLWREWRDLDGEAEGHWAYDPVSRERVPQSCVFIMLNPSTADGSVDDPTIRRCVGFARAWHFQRIEVINLFAFRATKPSDLLAMRPADDPWGPERLRHAGEALVGSGRVICAWGSHGGHLGADRLMLQWLEGIGCTGLQALRISATGHPAHPLYIPSDTWPVPFGGAG